MLAQTLETQTHVRQGLAIIDLHGEIDARAEAALNAAYVEAAAAAAPAVAPGIVLNFSGVNYINSTGIALIVGLLARARKTGCRLLAYGLTEHYVEIFRITRLADFVTLVVDEAAAVAEANRS